MIGMTHFRNLGVPSSDVASRKVCARPIAHVPTVRRTAELFLKGSIFHVALLHLIIRAIDIVWKN